MISEVFSLQIVSQVPHKVSEHHPLGQIGLCTISVELFDYGCRTKNTGVIQQISTPVKKNGSII